MKISEHGGFFILLFICNLVGVLLVANPVLGILAGSLVGVPLATIIYVYVYLRPNRATMNPRRNDGRHHERTL